MKSIQVFVFTLLFLGYGVLSGLAAEQQGGWNHIEHIGVWSNGLFVYPKEQRSFSCDDASVYVIRDDSYLSQKIMDLLILAYERDLEVQFTVHGCYNGMPKIVGVRLG